MKRLKLLRALTLVALLSCFNQTATAQVRVTIENFQPADGFFLTPVWTGMHDGSFDLFDMAVRSKVQLEVLAETGNTAPLDELFNFGVVRSSQTNNGGPIGPGFVGAFELINEFPADNPFVSYASMVVPSNDAFVGNGSPTAIRLFDENGDFIGTQVVEIRGENIYDAGTEVNNGSGAAGFSLGFDGNGQGPSTDDANGVVALHPDLLDNLVGLNTAAGTIIGSDGGGGIELDEMVGRLTFHVVGDVNGDGETNLLDISVFVDAISNAEFIPAADVNNDGEVGLLDVGPFVDLLGG